MRLEGQVAYVTGSTRGIGRAIAATLAEAGAAVVVNGFRDPQAAADVLRVGMSRPTLRLVVVADPHQLRQVGGEALLATFRPR